MINKKNRWLAAILSVMMVFCYMPSMAFAGGPVDGNVAGTTATVLAVVNDASKANEYKGENYKTVQAAIVENAETLGLELTDYDKLIETRKPAVFNDLYNSKPTDGYTQETLKAAFDEIVASRLVFQESMDKVNAAATASEPLEDLSYVTMIIDNLKNVKSYTMHSGKTIDEKKEQLNGYVKRYNALSDDQKKAVLLKVCSVHYASSTQTLNSLDVALKIPETKIATALKAVNDASDDSNYIAVQTAIEENAETLGLNLKDYNKLIKERKPAVFNDLYNSKPTDGYTLKELQDAFNEIVASRLVFQESMDLVNKASKTEPLENLDYVTRIIDNLENVKSYTMHSGKTIETKLGGLKGYAERYNGLSKEQQEEVLLYVSSHKTAYVDKNGMYARSSMTLTALDDALKITEAKIATALKAVNDASDADNYVAVQTAIETNAETLGLDLTDYEKLTDARKSAVSNDIFNDKTDKGYTLEELQLAFNKSVASHTPAHHSSGSSSSATPVITGDYTVETRDDGAKLIDIKNPIEEKIVDEVVKDDGSKEVITENGTKIITDAKGKQHIDLKLDKSEFPVESKVYVYYINEDNGKLSKVIGSPFKEETDGTVLFDAVDTSEYLIESAPEKNVVNEIGSNKFERASKGIHAIRTRWDEVENADGFIVYRSTAKNGKYTRIAKITDENIHEYRDGNLKANTHYYYKVVSYVANRVDGKTKMAKKSTGAKRYTTKKA